MDFLHLQNPSIYNPKPNPGPASSSQITSNNNYPSTPITPIHHPYLFLETPNYNSPFKGSRHFGAHSPEETLKIASDIVDLFADSSVPSVEDLGFDEDPFSKYIDVDKLAGSDGGGGGREEEEVNVCGGSGSFGKSEDVKREEGVDADVNGRSRFRHRHSISEKKAMPPHKLSELWVVDPKRAKRILANRQSAARSKQRKARYLADLETKVETLEAEATTLATQLTVYQRETEDLHAENAELKLLLQKMEHEALSRDDPNEALTREVDRLRGATGDARNAPSTLLNLGLHHSPDSQPSSPSAYPQLPQSPVPTSCQNIKLSLFPCFPSSASSPGHLHPVTPCPPFEFMKNDPIGCLQRLDFSSRQYLLQVESAITSSGSQSSSNTY